MRKTANTIRHRWIDDGEQYPIYCYTCSKCGQKKIKTTAFSASYYNQNNIYLSNRAPECQIIEQLNKGEI